MKVTVSLGKESNEQKRIISNNTLNVLKTVLTPTGDLKADTKRAENYAAAVGMDTANTEMLKVGCTQGMDVAAKCMVDEFTDEKGFDYAAMRARYG
jgi:hypothetical protein